MIMHASLTDIVTDEPEFASFPLFNTILHVLKQKGWQWRKRSGGKVHSMKGNWCRDFEADALSIADTTSAKYIHWNSSFVQTPYLRHKLYPKFWNDITIILIKSSYKIFDTCIYNLFITCVSHTAHVIAIGWTSVCLSVTCWYCVETVQPIVKLSSRPGSPMILVFWGLNVYSEFQWWGR